MKTKIFLILFFALVAIYLPNAASAGLPEAVDYLKNQTPDAWITQALVAAGETGVPIDHLKSVAEGGFNPTNDYAKTILALAAAGENPTTFGSIDYVAKLQSYYDGTQMGDATLLNDDIWSILALASIKKTGSAEAIAAKDFLLANQNADGGWGYAVGGSSGSNDTAAAVMALLEMGLDAGSAVITNAVAFLHTRQNDDGGFMNDPVWGTASDSGSDAWVISAIYRIGEQPAAWIKNGNSPLTHLQLLQDGADGGFWWMDPSGNPEFNNKAMTPYAVIALAGKSFPIGYYDIPQPIPDQIPAPDPAPSSGGGGIFIPVDCRSVEYDIWQNTCVDNWQYRNVLTIFPVNCTLTAEQDAERKRACVAPEAETVESIKPVSDVGDQADLEAEVLGVKIASSSAEQLLDSAAAEAAGIISGQTPDFIAQGTPGTARLGAGERAGVLNSFKSTFGYTPETQTDWENIIKISNNQLPSTVNSAAEARAKAEFKKVYGREADMENTNDKEAIDLMAYGLRPASRDFSLEQAGIGVFVKVYKYLPKSALDWDTVRAIAYSGVSL